MSTRQVRSRVPRCRCCCRCRRPRDGDAGGLLSAGEDSDSAVGSGGGGGDAESAADGFRVRVSLERFFSDERARVLVWAERERPAGWLLRRLRASLPLPLPGAGTALALVAGGCLLPPAEPLAVLRPDDLLELIISPCSRGEKEAAVEEEEEEAEAEGGAGGELEAVKRRALRLLDEVAARAGDEREAPPRRRRRVRRRRTGLASAGLGAVSARWRAEHAAGAGVVRSATPPRAARLVSAAAH